jgi:hypothetical protein
VALSEELLDILVCPKCRGRIHATQNEDGLVCEACRLLYPVRCDMAVMLIEEAVPLAGPAPSEGAR